MIGSFLYDDPTGQIWLSVEKVPQRFVIPSVASSTSVLYLYDKFVVGGPVLHHDGSSVNIVYLMPLGVDFVRHLLL